MVLSMLLGAAAAGALLLLNRPPAEAWSVVVQTRDRITVLQLGFVSQSVFRSSSVYRPVMEELGIEGSPERFFAEQAELRPVAETHALLVIGRAPNAAQAFAISRALTRELVEAFRERKLTR
jgi:hypothetical protein